MTFRQLFEGTIYQATKNAKEFIDRLDGMEKQVLKMKIFDRARTNYDTNWQKEYFYGDLKDKSKKDSKWIADLFNKYNYKGTEEDLVKVWLKNPKQYFKDM
jgi:hypothetical protein